MSERGFLEVTEAPGESATRAQLMRLVDRYQVVGDLARGRRVLEVGCGTGIGLRYLDRVASLAVGGDFDPEVVRLAQRQGSGTLVRLDAQSLPFQDRTFDVVCMAEAIYYVPRADAFFAEAARVLAPGGTLVVTSVNPGRSDFVRSAKSVRYLDAAELLAALRTAGLVPELRGSFPSEGGRRDRVLRVTRVIFARLNLIPGTLRGRALLKRLAYGPLAPLPPVLDPSTVEVPAASTIAAAEAGRFVILHAIGRKLS